MQRYGYSEV